MKELEDRILRDGKSLPGGILKVDNFINHQMDGDLMCACGREIIRLFKATGFTKVLTVEASGIAPSIFAGYLAHVPVVFAKKATPKTLSDKYVTTVHSFTKNRDYQVIVSKEYLSKDDKVLFIDDFLACGNAGIGIVDLCEQAGAELVGMAFLVEKAFQGGRKLIHERVPDLRIESLAVISALGDGSIEFQKD